jgi:hypothetical protein
LRQIFSRWQVSLGTELVKVKARELPTERMLAREQRTFSYDSSAGDWARSIKDYGSLQSVNLNTWMLVFADNDYRPAEQFFSTIQQMARAMQMNINVPHL